MTCLLLGFCRTDANRFQAHFFVWRFAWVFLGPWIFIHNFFYFFTRIAGSFKIFNSILHSDKYSGGNIMIILSKMERWTPIHSRNKYQMLSEARTHKKSWGKRERGGGRNRNVKHLMTRFACLPNSIDVVFFLLKFAIKHNLGDKLLARGTKW